MWTTSNFPVKKSCFVRLCLCSTFAIVLAYSGYVGSGVASAQEIAPDAPRPARSNRVSSTTPGRYSPRRVELKSVSVGRLNAQMTKLAGADFMAGLISALIDYARKARGNLTTTVTSNRPDGKPCRNHPMAPNGSSAMLADRR